MMQLTRRVLDPKRALLTFRSLNVQKHLPFIDRVSATQPFYCSISNADIYTKTQIINSRILQYSFSLQERLYLQRPFSSKPSQVNRDEVRNTAEDEDCELICQVVKRTEWSNNIETKLNSLNINLSNCIVLSVLRNLKETPETAFNFFNWASTKTDFSHTVSTYNAVIEILGEKSYIDQFWSIVAEMTNEGHKMQKKTYRQILRRFLDSNMVEDAVALFVLATEKDSPSNLDCRMILHQLSLSGSPDVDLVYRVLETFENGNGKCNKETFDAVHRCLTMAGRFDEAVGVMKTMEEAGFLPDNDTYSQLVFGLCKAGTLNEACRVLDVMRELGCTPNLKTWNILIDGHCKAGEMDQLLGYFELMVERGCNADREVVDILVKTLCSQNRIEDANRFLCKMISNKGLKVSGGTLKDMLQTLLSGERLQDAIKLSDLMVTQGFSAIADPFYNLFAQKGTVEGAVDYLNKVTRNFPRYLASESYFSMLNAFCKAGKKAEAQILLSKCPRHIQRNPDILFEFASGDTPSAAQNTSQT